MKISDMVPYVLVPGSFCPGIFNWAEKKECEILDFWERKPWGIAFYHILSDRGGNYLSNETKFGCRKVVVVGRYLKFKTLWKYDSHCLILLTPTSMKSLETNKKM